MGENPVPNFSKLTVQTFRQVENINELPDEIVEKILSYINWKDLLLSVRYVQKSWEKLVNEEKIWKTVQCTIRRKYIYGSSDYEDREIQKLISILKSTKTIQHIKTMELNDKEVQLLIRTICNHCRSLRSLMFYDCPPLDANLFIKLLDNIPYIEKLGISVTLEEAEMCIELLAACENLRSLFLHAVSSENIVMNIKSLADGCPNLTDLSIPGLYYETDDLVYFIEKKSHQLKTFEFNGKYLKPETILTFRLCKYLKRIDFHIDCFVFSENSLEAIGSSPVLKSLSLTMCGSCPGLFKLSAYFKRTTLPNIVELQLDIGPITANIAEILKNSLPNVQHLALIYNYEEIETDITELLKLKNLTVLELSGYAFPFPDNWLVQFEQCEKLESLNFCSCEELSNSQLSQIISDLELKKLNISYYNSLTDDVLADIAQCQHLKYLNISCCAFSGDLVLKMLSQMRLNVIEAFSCTFITADHVQKMKEYVITVQSNYI